VVLLALHRDSLIIAPRRLRMADTTCVHVKL
jgi:hypothetical protein